MAPPATATPCSSCSGAAAMRSGWSAPAPSRCMPSPSSIDTGRRRSRRITHSGPATPASPSTSGPASAPTAASRLSTSSDGPATLSSMAAERRVGLVSDTHGLVRPEALEALRGVELIVHAGDVGAAAVLERLAEVAPVAAIRGNNDRGPWADALPETRVVEVGDALLYVVHDVGELELDPVAAGFHVVVSGHSHRPRVERRGGVLFVNPGSIGPRRFSLPIALAQLRVSGIAAEASIVELPA